MNGDGRQLIFLLSQPRAGSTLLQRIIGEHPDVHTTQEPTFMLHPLYALRAEGHEAEYHAGGARLFTRQFLATLPEGEAEYDEALRRMALHLYGRALARQEARFFLDKTPRYYFIIPDLARLFPAARFILLRRHPLAVLHSMWTTWIKDHWFMLHGFRHDLLTAPRRLVSGQDALGKRVYPLHFEALVREPAATLPPLFNWLGLDYDPALVDYGRDPSLARWQLADQKRVYTASRPLPEAADAWQRALASPQFWRLAGDYRRALGDDIWRGLGYEGTAVDRLLAERAPAPWRRAATVSLDWLTARPPDDRTRLERARLKLARLANVNPHPP